VNKGMLKNADGSPMTKDDFRIVLKSDIIINSPHAYLSDDLKAAIAKAFLKAATKDKADYERLSDGKNRPWEPVANADYDKTIELVRFVAELRKKKS
jgi:phosphonate transport system substrate-binding protein